MITGSRAAGDLAGPRAGWQAAAARWARRVAVAALRLAVSFTGWAGVAVLTPMLRLLPWWAGSLILMPVGVACVVSFFLPVRVDASGRRVAVFWTCRTLAVGCAFALFCVLTVALPALDLQEHGVVERAVVTGESSATDNSGAGPLVYYFYSLRALSGAPIHGTLAGDGTLSVGEHVTVLADPGGRADPVLDTRTSASGYLLAADGLAGAIAVLLAVAAWTWPRRPARE